MAYGSGASSKAWEVWARETYRGEKYGEDGFVEAFSDKGHARAKMARLKRSHPHITYYLKHRPSPKSAHFGTRAHERRGKARARRR